MKKNLFLLSSILMMGTLLAACGTADTVEEDTAPVEAPEETPAEETTTSEETVEGAAPAGTLIQSDEQNYELHVLDGYELTAEEPNKDSLYVTDNSAIFMRIETFSPEDIDFASAAESMKQTLKAVNPDAEAVEASNFDGTNFKQSTAYEVPSAEGSVTGIVYENDKLIVRLTIFDDSTVNVTEDFISMGKTIQSLE